MEGPDIVFSNSEIFDFIGCMVCMSVKNKLSKNTDKYSNVVHPNTQLVSWTANVISNLSPEMLETFNFFFNSEIPFGEGILKLSVYRNISSVDELIHTIESMDSDELLAYFINCDDNYALAEDINRIRNSEAYAYRYINEAFSVGRENKWRIFALINEPDIYKKRFIKFISMFYRDCYRNAIKNASSFTEAESERIKKYIMKDPFNRVREFVLIDANEPLPAKLVIGFSYFLDLGFSVIYDTVSDVSIITIGTRYLERWRITNGEYITDEQMIGICSVIGDKTRIAILKMLKDGPVYGSQIAEKFRISNPAASYHLEQFLQNGLVRLEKTGHRLYYHLKEERLEQVINYLRSFITPEK